MWRRRHVYLIAMTLAALAVFPAAFVQPRLLDDLRNFVFDSFQRAAPRPYDPQAPVKIVGIDEASLKAFGQWPWPRTRLAELTDRLTSMGASAIAFDFIFAEPDRTSLENMLAIAPNESLRRDLSRTLAKTAFQRSDLRAFDRRISGDFGSDALDFGRVEGTGTKSWLCHRGR